MKYESTYPVTNIGVTVIYIVIIIDFPAFVLPSFILCGILVVCTFLQLRLKHARIYNSIQVLVGSILQGCQVQERTSFSLPFGSSILVWGWIRLSESGYLLYISSCGVGCVGSFPVLFYIYELVDFGYFGLTTRGRDCILSYMLR